VYEDKDEAIYTMNNLNSFENNNIIIEASLCKHEDSKFHYFEDDNNIDEEDYDFLKDENKNLKNKIKIISEECNDMRTKYMNDTVYSYIFITIMILIGYVLFILK
jgi:hypothetical protein